MRILGIETSCDETGIAVYDSEQGIIANVLHSQTTTHARYGGVVPELASRDHIRIALPLVQQALAGINPQSLDGVAYTAGPGLNGPLLVGASLGRSLAFGWDKPAIAVHHMEGHLLAPMLEPTPPEFPFLALLVSGGHTLLVGVAQLGEYTILGETLDDAVGEAFDKTAKLLGLGYPGGAALSQLAETGKADRFHFPRPMTNRPGLDFSFSGLKTHVLNTVRQQSDLDEQCRADIAHAFVVAAVDTLVIKCRRAIEQTGHKRLVVSGGVSANRQLRAALTKMSTQRNTTVYFPALEFCTDNGAMIAYTGAIKLQHGHTQSLGFQVKPRWTITDN